MDGRKLARREVSRPGHLRISYWHIYPGGNLARRRGQTPAVEERWHYLAGDDADRRFSRAFRLGLRWRGLVCAGAPLRNAGRFARIH